MKKTLLATAIAGALGASAAAQAATIYNQDGTQIDLYGNIQIAYASQESLNETTGEVDGADELLDNGSTIGIAGQHMINTGLTGYFKAEWEHQADEEKSSGGIDNGDQAYAGLKGNFGDARLGSWDPLIDDWIQDPITNNEYFDVSDSSTAFGTVGVNDFGAHREGNKLQYISPSFAGLQFAAGTQYEGDGESDLRDSGNASFFGGVKYAFGAFSIGAVYDNLDNFELADGTEAGDQYGITAEYTMQALRVAVKAERFAGEESDTDVDFYGIGARYGYGFGDVYGAYQYVDADADSSYATRYGDDTYNEVVLGASYNISSAMYTFVEVAMYDREEDETDGVAVGAVYSF